MARIAFYQNISYPNLGVMYLSAALKSRGHEVRLFLKNAAPDRDLVERSLREFSPDIAAFSVTTGNQAWALTCAAIVKAKDGGIFTVMGGPHPTFFPEVLDHDALDAVCVGEGEEAMGELADRFADPGARAQILNFHIKHGGASVKNEVRPLVPSLDILPVPDRALYYGAYPELRLSTLAFITGRGCPYECSYCFNKSLKEIYRGKGSYVRRRSPEAVIAEIAENRRRYRFRTVYFQDDVFTLGGPFLREFLPRYRAEIGLPFICLSRVEQLNEETVRLLKESGCRSLFFGIESGNETIRRTVLKRNISNAEIEEKAALLKKYGIPFRTYNILGIPGETRENAWETVRLNARIRTDHPWCSLLAPYPGTEIAALAEAASGRKLSPDEFSPTFFAGAGLAVAHETANLQKIFAWAVWFPALIPLFRRLVRLRARPFFELAFVAAYSITALRSERLSARDVLMLARHNLRNFLWTERT